jgi:maleylpyruvate isomerase
MDADPPRPEPAAALRELDASTERLLSSVRSLDDAALRGPSALPGWTRGHVVTHLARNADGLGRLVTWAITGVETPMYGSREAKVAEIEAGAGRPLDAQQADVQESAARFREAVSGVNADVGDRVLRLGSGAEVEAWELPLLRIRELEIHHVDLAAGYAVEAWTDTFWTRTLDQVAGWFAAQDTAPFGRLVADGGGEWIIGSRSESLTGPGAVLLGWLLGRHDGTGLSPRGRVDVPPAPPWV